MNEAVATKPRARPDSSLAVLMDLPGGVRAHATGPILGPDGIYSRWVLVTRPVAEAWLSLNTNNRHVGPSLSERYGSDMLAGEWQNTHQGIAFRDDEVLADGQNRLKAICATESALWMLVTWNLSRDAMMAIDRCRLRSVVDNMRILGIDIGNNEMATVRKMITGPTVKLPRQVLPDSCLREFFDAAADAVVFASSVTGRNVGSSPVRAVIARAYYHADHVRLEQFARVLSDSTVEGVKNSSAARMLRDALLSKRIKGSAGMAPTSIYRRTQNALRYFLDYKDIGKLYENSDDLYPLPIALEGIIRRFNRETE